MMSQLSRNKGVGSKVTKREFLMIALLLLALEGYLLATYVVVPKWNELKQLNDTNQARSVLVEKLKTDFSKMDTYKLQLEALTQENDQLKATIPSYVSQEEVLLLLDKNSKEAVLQVNLMGFEAMTVMQGDAFTADVNQPEAAAQPVGASVLPAETAKETITAPLVVDQTISVNFSGGYNSVFNFIKSLENNLRKVYVKNLSLTSAQEGDISGSMSVSFLSYVDAMNYDKYLLNVSEMTGKLNPFAPYAGYGQDNSQVQTEAVLDPNIYILLNSYLDNAQKVIMGQYPQSDTEIYFNENAQTKGKLTFTGDANSFSYSMSLGTVTRNSSQNVKIENGAIRVKIVSLARKDAKDSVSIALDIENKTGVPVEVQVMFDDGNSPRVKMGNLTGNVTMK